jgi:hypothetical protein
MRNNNLENISSDLSYLFEKSELKYIKKSIEFISDNYEKMFAKFENEYKLEKERLKQNKEYHKTIDECILL